MTKEKSLPLISDTSVVIWHYARDYKVQSFNTKDGSYETKYKILVASLKKKKLESKVISRINNGKSTTPNKCYKCGNNENYARDFKVKSYDTMYESYETKYKRLVSNLKKQNLESKVLLAEEKKWDANDPST